MIGNDTCPKCGDRFDVVLSVRIPRGTQVGAQGGRLSLETDDITYAKCPNGHYWKLGAFNMDWVPDPEEKAPDAI